MDWMDRGSAPDESTGVVLQTDAQYETDNSGNGWSAN